MNTSLTTEIIRRIFLNIGISTDGELTDTGLLSQHCLLDKTFAVDYDNGISFDCPIWAGEIELRNDKIKGLLINLSHTDTGCAIINEVGNLEPQKIPEFALALRVASNPIYLLRLAYDDDDLGTCLIEDQSNWIVPSILIQAQALVGMEMLVSSGLVWNKALSYDSALFTAIARVVEM